MQHRVITDTISTNDTLPCTLVDCDNINNKMLQQ